MRALLHVARAAPCCASALRDTLACILTLPTAPRVQAQLQQPHQSIPRCNTSPALAATPRPASSTSDGQATRRRECKS